MDGKRSLVGSLSNDDDDSNKNGKKKQKKTLALDWQNNNFARACMTFFFVHFFAVVARLRLKTA